MTTPPAGAGSSLCDWKRRLGDHYRSAGHAELALQAYQAALSFHDEMACEQASRSAAGALALELRNFSQAEQLLAGIALPVAVVNHGFALLGLSRPADALADFDGVLARDESNDEATFGRGMCLLALGRMQEADAAFATLLARSPGHVSAEVARQQRARLRQLLEKH